MPVHFALPQLGISDCHAVTELEVSKLQNASAERIWVDPSGVHHIMLIQHFGNYETFYFHTKWKKVRAVGRLKGLQITSIGWNPEACSDSNTG